MPRDVKACNGSIDAIEMDCEVSQGSSLINIVFFSISNLAFGTAYVCGLELGRVSKNQKIGLRCLSYMGQTNAEDVGQNSKPR